MKSVIRRKKNKSEQKETCYGVLVFIQTFFSKFMKRERMDAEKLQSFFALFCLQDHTASPTVRCCHISFIALLA